MTGEFAKVRIELRKAHDMGTQEEKYVKGQRWISEAEPELGLGTVSEVGKRRIRLSFPSSEVERDYSKGYAPIRRVRFQEGDRLRERDGGEFVVRGVEETAGLVFYKTSDGIVPEFDLSDAIGLSGPRDRLLAGRWDSPGLFEFRLEALRLRGRMAASPVRGLLGGRVELFDHQMFIASEASERRAPKLLLADETGLGKTIEACLIMHRLILTGRVSRVLILVPETLVHQWFVEMYRRFNLAFRIADENFCRSVEKTAPSGNPFLDDQLFLTSLDFVNQNKRRASEASGTQWDMIVVDEAHRIKEESMLYGFIAGLAEKTQRMLLLSGTPEQLGRKNHFARLKLLDPSRFYDYGEFLRESERYREIAGTAERIMDESMSMESLAEAVGSVAPDLLSDEELFRDGDSGNGRLRQRLLERLIDRYGTGRVMFRNTRAVVKGFAERKALLTRLSGDDDSHDRLEALSEIFGAEIEDRPLPFELDYADDKRIEWLADFLRGLTGEKALLICRSAEKALAIEKALALLINRKVAVFHEGLSMLQRDRNAAWFSEPDGAVLLISSEIGSEGRNFQFARHLVLFDLPLDPEQLEQRIGRLDRIGQKSDILIHVPHIEESPQEVIAKWYHEGLGQFETCLTGGLDIYEAFGERVGRLACRYHSLQREDARRELERLLQDTAEFRRDRVRKISEGRDRLLELSSYRPEKIDSILETIRSIDEDTKFERFVERLFDLFGVEMEHVGERDYIIKAGERYDESFRLAKPGGQAATFDRQTAVKREDMAFITPDHPGVASAMELFLGGQAGNCTVCEFESASPGLVLDAVFVLECLAPKYLHSDRFMPPTLVRVAVDHNMDCLGEDAFEKMRLSPVKNAEQLDESARKVFFRTFLPKMLSRAEKTTRERADCIVARSLAVMTDMLNEEIVRLEKLKKVNPMVSDAEIATARNELDSLTEHLKKPVLRLDCARLLIGAVR